LAFALLNLGLCLIFLWLFSRLSSSVQKWANPLLVFGRSALFFYILHLYIFAFIGLFFASKGGSGLALMYPIWILGLFLLYFLCRRYGTFKKNKPLNSIWRFF
jgi:hypothetical protein